MISNIAVTYGSVAVVPQECAGMLVSKEYTVLAVDPSYDARVVWALLRSPEIRAELLLRTTGANRTRVHWSKAQDMAFPYPAPEVAERFIEHYEEAEAARRMAEIQQRKAIDDLNQGLSLDEEEAHFILDAFKPPR